jgi:hypothetical protein
MTAPYVGKTCPYCQYPIKAGVLVVVCPACGMPHHEDCWAENHGCTTFGCHAGRPRPQVVPQLHPPPPPRARTRHPRPRVEMLAALGLATLIFLGNGLSWCSPSRWSAAGDRPASHPLHGVAAKHAWRGQDFLYGERNAPRAVEELRRAIRLNRDVPAVYYHLGVAAKQVNDASLAVWALREYLARAPHGQYRAEAERRLLGLEPRAVVTRLWADPDADWDGQPGVRLQPTIRLHNLQGERCVVSAEFAARGGKKAWPTVAGAPGKPPVLQVSEELIPRYRFAESGHYSLFVSTAALQARFGAQTRLHYRLTIRRSSSTGAVLVSTAWQPL